VNWSRVIGNVGRTLITTGVLVLLFVVYQLWGTALHERRAQSNLRSEFSETVTATAPEAVRQFEAAETELPATLEPEAVLTASSEEQPATAVIDYTKLVIDPRIIEYGPPPPTPESGDATARLRIPKIGIDKVIVEGVGTNTLKEGPGHYPGTPLPGQAGNAAIAGHRTTYGAPFYNLNELEPNDLIYVTTSQGAFQYRVVESLVVRPSDTWVLDPSEDDRLTLTTCHPRLSARQRLIVIAELIGPAAPSNTDLVAGEPETPVELPSEQVGGDPTTTTMLVGEGVADTPPSTVSPVTSAPPTTPAPTTTQLTLGVVTGQELADRAAGGEITHGGIDGEQAASWPVIFWAVAAGLVWFGFWYLSRQWRRWPAFLLGTPVFLIVLFIFFENFSRLLPSGV
jgi:sortase A